MPQPMAQALPAEGPRSLWVWWACLYGFLHSGPENMFAFQKVLPDGAVCIGGRGSRWGTLTSILSPLHACSITALGVWSPPQVMRPSPDPFILLSLNKCCSAISTVMFHVLPCCCYSCFGARDTNCFLKRELSFPFPISSDFMLFG